MPQIPQAVLDSSPTLDGLNLRHRGKVRDSHDLPGYQDLMLVVVTDRISIFDHVLPAKVRQKGQILNAMSHFWTKQVLEQICLTDLVAAGAEIDPYLPEHLRGDPELQKRATVVRRFTAPDIEDIVRLNLTGSVLAKYKETGLIYGQAMPAGLRDGDRLPFPKYTPTTKSPDGHDEPIPPESVAERYGYGRELLAIKATCGMANFAHGKGIVFADNKLEITMDGNGNLVVVDEKGTPDSSRCWDAKALDIALEKGLPPPSLDKDKVRAWGKTVGVNNRNPANPADVEFVHSLIVPDEVLDTTSRIYRYIFWRLTGMKLEKYQREVLGIDVKDRPLKVLAIIGSKSDAECIPFSAHDIKIIVMSCHRNPEALRKFAEETDADVIIAGAGKAAALPGVLKAWLCYFGKSHIPVIGVACPGQTESDNTAAALSIENLPGQPVELDPNGEAYFGSKGFFDAGTAALHDEFLPKTIEVKPVVSF